MRKVEVGYIQILGQLSTMQRFVKVIVEVRVNDIMGNRILLFLEYNAIVNVMEAVIVVVSLIRKPTIVIEDVL